MTSTLIFSLTSDRALLDEGQAGRNPLAGWWQLVQGTQFAFAAAKTFSQRPGKVHGSNTKDYKYTVIGHCEVNDPKVIIRP